MTESFNPSTSTIPAAKGCHIFLHIPKTGGITLYNIIARQYPKQGICNVRFDIPESFDTFFALSDTQRAEIRCLTGHFPFGMHQYLPGPFTYFTVLRDPIGRFLSEYKYLKDYPEIRSDLPIPLSALKSLEDYLAYSEDAGVLNFQTRQIIGALPYGKLESPLSPLPPDAVAIAKHNLENHFIVVGCLDRFDESVVLMKQRLEWKHSVFCLPKNTNIRTTSTTDNRPAPATLDKIQEKLAIDQAIYDFASQRLDQAILQADKEFNKQIKQLKQMTAVASTARRYYRQWVPQPIRTLARQILSPILR